MNINDDHMYHGAALTQIAEDAHFTAINAFKTAGRTSRAAFRVNDDLGVYLKYSAAEPAGPAEEFVFTFNRRNLDELGELSQQANKVSIALVCVKVREICCLPYRLFEELVSRRQIKVGAVEDSYTILVTAPQGKRMRVYVNAPGRRGRILGEAIFIPRSAFPGDIFK